MYCKKCGAQINDGSKFCYRCGDTVNSARDVPAARFWNAPPEIPPYEYIAVPEKTRKPFNLKRFIIIAAACAIVVALAILVPVLIENDLSNRYNSAVASMDSSPLGAKAVFVSLGDYKDSETHAQECQKIYDYGEACAKMDSKDYSGAKAAFKELGSYKDASEKADECQNIIDYDNASEHLESGDIQDAYDAFLALGDYSDSAQKASECKQSLDYDKAVSLMNAGSYSAAYDGFMALGSYKDSESLSKDCAYKLAGQDFVAGKFYSAQKLYLGLGEYLDSAALADKCPQKCPKTGQYNRSSSIKGGRKDSLKIYAPNDSNYTYIKIYRNSSNEWVLVDTVWLAPGKTVSVKLPGGYDYSFKMAYGKVWYGATEMFGYDGSYSAICKYSSGDSSSVYFDKPWSDSYYNYWYVYKFKIRQDDYVDGTSITLDDFISDANVS